MIYTKLNDINSTRYYANGNESVRQSVIDNVFTEFSKGVHNKVNSIITTYNTESNGLGELVKEYYLREQLLDYFLVIY